VLLPGPDEAHGQSRRFVVGSRLTEHVRHRSKYLDMPVSDALAFRFGEPDQPLTRARSLKELTGFLTTMSPDRLQPYLLRHDFSRWLGGVFRDASLAQHVLRIEAEQHAADAGAAIAQAIRARYDTTINPSTERSWQR
jgi:hypothetical protein